jgi:hypothetical protein
VACGAVSGILETKLRRVGSAQQGGAPCRDGPDYGAATPNSTNNNNRCAGEGWESGVRSMHGVCGVSARGPHARHYASTYGSETPEKQRRAMHSPCAKTTAGRCAAAPNTNPSYGRARHRVLKVAHMSKKVSARLPKQNTSAPTVTKIFKKCVSGVVSVQPQLGNGRSRRQRHRLRSTACRCRGGPA